MLHESYYYDALKHYYGALDHIDWVAYYKNHGYAINGGCGPYGGGRVNYAPVVVTPGMPVKAEFRTTA